MSILSKVVTGQIGRAQKLVIYGPESIGKSTLASRFPEPLFLDVEGGTSQLAVARIGRDAMPSLADFESALAEVASAKPCKTLVVDTIDWVEPMALDAICAESGDASIKGVEDFGYGKGYVKLKERMTITMSKFDAIVRAGMHVVLLAHSKVTKFEPPDGAGAFDRYELKLSKFVAPIVKEWADALFFGNFRTQIAEKGKGDAVKYKAVGGRERVLYATRCSAWDAKNRHGLGDVEKWEISTIEKAFRAVGAPWSSDIAVPANTTTGEPSGADGETAHETKPEPQEPPDDIPGLPPVDALRADVARIIAGNAVTVNAYLVANGKIREAQTWRDAADDYLKRILKNPAGFLKVAVNGGAK